MKQKPDNTITRTEALLFEERKKQAALSARLRAAIELVTTYLDDGAAYSALRVLREAVDAEKQRGKDES